MRAISGARAAAGAGAAVGAPRGAPVRANRAANASPAAAGENFAPAARARGSRPRVRALPGARHVCNGRGGALRGAGARREGAAPRRAAADLCAGLAAGDDHSLGFGRRAASKGRRAAVQTAPLALRRR